MNGPTSSRQEPRPRDKRRDLQEWWQQKAARNNENDENVPVSNVMSPEPSKSDIKPLGGDAQCSPTPRSKSRAHINAVSAASSTMEARQRNQAAASDALTCRSCEYCVLSPPEAQNPRSQAFAEATRTSSRDSNAHNFDPDQLEIIAGFLDGLVAPRLSADAHDLAVVEGHSPSNWQECDQLGPDGGVREDLQQPEQNTDQDGAIVEACDLSVCQNSHNSDRSQHERFCPYTSDCEASEGDSTTVERSGCGDVLAAWEDDDELLVPPASPATPFRRLVRSQDALTESLILQAFLIAARDVSLDRRRLSARQDGRHRLTVEEAAQGSEEMVENDVVSHQHEASPAQSFKTPEDGCESEHGFSEEHGEASPAPSFQTVADVDCELEMASEASEAEELTGNDVAREFRESELADHEGESLPTLSLDTDGCAAAAGTAWQGEEAAENGMPREGESEAADLESGASPDRTLDIDECDIHAAPGEPEDFVEDDVESELGDSEMSEHALAEQLLAEHMLAEDELAWLEWANPEEFIVDEIGDNELAEHELAASPAQPMDGFGESEFEENPPVEPHVHQESPAWPLERDGREVGEVAWEADESAESAEIHVARADGDEDMRGPDMVEYFEGWGELSPYEASSLSSPSRTSEAEGSETHEGGGDVESELGQSEMSEHEFAEHMLAEHLLAEDQMARLALTEAEEPADCEPGLNELAEHAAADSPALPIDRYGEGWLALLTTSEFGVDSSCGEGGENEASELAANQAVEPHEREARLAPAETEESPVNASARELGENEATIPDGAETLQTNGREAEEVASRAEELAENGVFQSLEEVEEFSQRLESRPRPQLFVEWLEEMEAWLETERARRAQEAERISEGFEPEHDEAEQARRAQETERTPEGFEPEHDEAEQVEASWDTRAQSIALADELVADDDASHYVNARATHVYEHLEDATLLDRTSETGDHESDEVASGSEELAADDAESETSENQLLAEHELAEHLLAEHMLAERELAERQLASVELEEAADSNELTELAELAELAEWANHQLAEVLEGDASPARPMEGEEVTREATESNAEIELAQFRENVAEEIGDVEEREQRKAIEADLSAQWRRYLSCYQPAWPEPTILDVKDHCLFRHSFGIQTCCFFARRERAQRQTAEERPLREQFASIPESPPIWHQWQIECSRPEPAPRTKKMKQIQSRRRRVVHMR